jgi:alpha-beta hydrolase superfamily lysophospholipase
VSYSRFKFTARDGAIINVHKWGLDEGRTIKGVVQISHGMAEWAYRYDYFAKALNREGYIVYANDHRGHGLTAPSVEDIGYISDKDGFIDMVEDMQELNQQIREDHPSLPLVLFGHSMGSFLSQKYIQLYGSDLAGVILSGSNGKQGPVINLGIALAYLEMRFKGRRHRSRLLDQLSFGAYNRAFPDNRTRFDWLSRDQKQVNRYIEDPYCGGIFTSSFFYDFLRGIRMVTKGRYLKTVPQNLPIYILSGSMDPVGGFGKGLEELKDMYITHGLKEVSLILYPGGRHEMLNEINRDEVIGDIVSWLNKTLI